MLRAPLLCLLLTLAPVPASTLQAQEAETRVVTAGAQEYEVSGFNRWLRGEDYRALWQLPIELPVLDLERVGDGLRPRFPVGDGRGLALVGADGRSYTFRALDKDLARALPDSWYYTVPAELLQDQTVADHPASAVIVPRLADAVGILHTSPRLVVMPDSPRLGEFAGAFAGRVGTIEEYPTAASDAHSGFHGATEILSTVQAWERTRRGQARLDAKALLRARLLDILVGDWDRHQEQFRWARMPDHERLQPLPEDRDHAFTSYEGFALSIARTRWPRLVRFTDRIGQMEGLNQKGFEVDRWVLSELPSDSYLRTAEEIVAALTDDVIAHAVRAMPEEYHPIGAETLTRRLIHRRNDLLRAAEVYYEQLAGEVDVHATDLDDEVLVEHRGASTRVLVRAPSGETRFERTFNDLETREVRIHLGAGADTVVASGPGGVGVVIVAGPGPDRIRLGGTPAEVYDVQLQDTVEGDGPVRVRPLAGDPEPLAATRPWEMPPDRGGRSYPIIWSALEPDSDLFFGGGLVSTRYDLRSRPFAARHRLRMGVATGRGAPRFEYDATFRPPDSSLAYGITLQANGLARLNYHGLGNETRGEDDETDDFFEAHGREIRAGGSIEGAAGADGFWSLSGSISRFANRDDDPTLLSTERPYGFGPFWSTGLRAGWRLDTRRRTVPPEEDDWRVRSFRLGDPYTGFALRLGADISPPLLDVRSWYGGVDGAATAYLPLADRLTLAVRAGGRHVWGDFPWQAAAFLGGDQSVRGYRPQRFGGRSSVYGNLELRYAVTRASIIVPGELGIFGLADVGRVWADGEDSDRWHPAAGGGLFFLLPELETGFHLGVAAGSEGTLVHMGSGFAF